MSPPDRGATPRPFWRAGRSISAARPGGGSRRRPARLGTPPPRPVRRCENIKQLLEEAGARPIPRREAHELHHRQGVPETRLRGDRGILRPPCARKHGRHRGRAGFRGFSRGNRRHGLYPRGLRCNGVLRYPPQKGRIGPQSGQTVKQPVRLSPFRGEGS